MTYFYHGIKLDLVCVPPRDSPHLGCSVEGGKEGRTEGGKDRWREGQRKGRTEGGKDRQATRHTKTVATLHTDEDSGH